MPDKGKAVYPNQIKTERQDGSTTRTRDVDNGALIEQLSDSVYRVNLTSSRCKEAAEGESYPDSHLNQWGQLLSHLTLSTPYHPHRERIFRHRTTISGDKTLDLVQITGISGLRPDKGGLMVAKYGRINMCTKSECSKIQISVTSSHFWA